MSLSNELKFSDIQTISQLRNGMEQLYRNRDYHRMYGDMRSRLTDTIHDMNLIHLDQIIKIDDIIQSGEYTTIGNTRAIGHMNRLRSKEDKIEHMKSLIVEGQELVIANVSSPSEEDRMLRLWFQTNDYGIIVDQSISNGITLITDIQNESIHLNNIYDIGPQAYFVLGYTNMDRFTTPEDVLNRSLELSLSDLGRHIESLERDVSLYMDNIENITEDYFNNTANDTSNEPPKNPEPKQTKKSKAVKTDLLNIIDLI